MLSSIQSRYDYAPKENHPGSGPGSGPGSPTTACDNVCRTLLEVANTVRTHEVRSMDMYSINLRSKTPNFSLFIFQIIEFLWFDLI